MVLEGQRLLVESGPTVALIKLASLTTSVFTVFRKDFRTGYAILRYVLTMGSAHGYASDMFRARFFALLHEHWFEPLADDVGKARLAHAGLLAAGDLQFASYADFISMQALLECAPTLDECAADVERALAFAARTSHRHSSETFVAF